MPIYLIIFNDGISFRIEEIYFSELKAAQKLQTMTKNYQIIQFKTADMPIQDNGLNHIREIDITDYEIE